MMPYAETDVTPSEALMTLKLREGVLTLLGADDRFYPTLFDFAKVSSLSPEKWLLKRRLEAAYDLLCQDQLSVTEVAAKVGFKNRSHFTKTFKERFGKSPSGIGHKNNSWNNKNELQNQ